MQSASEALKGRKKGCQLRSARWCRPRRQNLRFSRVNPLAGHEEDRSRPGRKQIEAGNEFGRHRGQESPMPAQQLDKNQGSQCVQGSIRWRQSSGSKQWQSTDLDGIDGDCDQPRQPVLRCLYGFQKIKQLHTPLGYTQKAAPATWGQPPSAVRRSTVPQFEVGQKRRRASLDPDSRGRLSPRKS
jgi:hypothetical protein